MALGLYRATGAAITAAIRLLGIDVRVSGLESLERRPVIFVSNHFTRLETLLLPYVIWNRFERPVRSLATHAVFKGALARYMRAVGVISTRDPARNLTIVSDLMRGTADWVIYPEGGLVKNKKTVGRWRRLRLDRPERRGAPHTGAAMLALKSEMRKRRYLHLAKKGNREKAAFYEERYGFATPGDLATRSAVIVPVNITFPHVRPGENPLTRLARLLRRSLDPRLTEELLVEGAILFRGHDISVHFGEPIDVADHLDSMTELLRRISAWFRRTHRNDLFLRRQARRLTQRSMRSVYAGTEVNLEHLFCYALRAARRDALPVERFHHALYLMAMELREAEGTRLHPMLEKGVHALATGSAWEPLESVVQLATDEGVLRRENGTYVIDRAALRQEHDFHSVRLKKMVQVIANEVEPVGEVVEAVREIVNLDDAALGRRMARALSRGDRARFHRDYARWHDPEESKPEALGEPFLLKRRFARAGVVLVHGYLASPEQMRPMAEHLNRRGYNVYVVRLDGHGTAPEHLREVSWASWMESVAQGWAVISHRCRWTAIGGFSLGGALASLFAARCPGGVDGLFTINAPMRLRNRLTPLVPIALGASRALRAVANGRGKDIGRLRNVSETPEINYEIDWLSSVRQLQLAVRACRRGLGEVRAPALVVQADDDPVVHPSSAALLARKLGSASCSVVRVPGRHHIVVRGEGSEEIFERVAAFLDELRATRG